MKFLLFNLVVAGALVYLFTADRVDVHAAADRVYETADEIKSVARNAVSKGRKLLQGDEAAPLRSNPPVPKALPQTRKKPAPEVAPVPPPEAAPVPPPVKQVARSNPTPTISPEVARRRDEVLGIASPMPILAPVAEIKNGESFMSPAQRRKELFTLAEEMELLYARKFSE